MIPRFFIDRPIFATVLSLVITLAGAVSIRTLPIAQYPEVAPPTVVVTAIYPGANALTMQDTVAAPIEEQVSGVEGMMYMSSQCTNDGTYTLTVTFKMGTNADIAQVLVQNRVSLAQPVIPELVQREGIVVRKQLPNTLMIVNLISPNRRYDDTYLSNFSTIEIRDELGRLPGVAGVGYLGQRDYSMRIWLNPEKLASLNLTAADVVDAVTRQNIQVAAGQIGQSPVPKGQQFQLTINTRGRLIDPGEFGDIIVKVGEIGSSAIAPATAAAATAAATSAPTTPGMSMGSAGPSSAIVRLRDVVSDLPERTEENAGQQAVGGIQLGAQQYDQAATLDGQPTVALTVYGLPGANSIDTAKSVRAKMEELKRRFPEGIDYSIVYDTTPFIQQSVNEVFLTLLDAVVLVAIVVLVFLQSWRAALIPLVAVPVAIIGTFAVMAALGFSLNTLTLFGLVLAIGIVVDDAIVVVENVERWLEQGLEPKEATRKAMDEVTGPVIAIALVLAAVFIPAAFIGGITGQFFRQFAVTIAVSTLISAFNSLTLSPALAALLLRSRSPEHDRAGLVEKLIWGAGTGAVMGWLLTRLEVWYPIPEGPMNGPALTHFILGWVAVAVAAFGGYHHQVFFRGFNKAFGAGTAIYARIVGYLLRLTLIVLLVYAGLLVLTWHEFTRTPTGFVPQQDKGYLLLNVQLPDSAAAERTQRAMARIEQTARETPGVANTIGIAGQSLILNANAPNLGSLYIMLKPFEQRPGLTSEAIARNLEERCRTAVRGAKVRAFGAPPIEGLGTTGGFKMVIEDRGNLGTAELQRASDAIVNQGGADPGFQGLFNTARFDTPWVYLEIDRTKCLALGVPLSDVFNTLQYNFGSYYVNNFNEFGRNWQVNVQADPRFRDRVREVGQLQLRNGQGQMIPLRTLLRVRDASGPVVVQRYNLYPAAIITGDVTPGTSSGEAVPRMEATAAAQLPRAMALEWTELTYLQNQAGNTALYAFGLAVVFVFLVLAAQYESWKLPLAVILVVPMCLLFAVLGVNIAGQDITVFTQIGLIVLVGLACKNAILIVEFAKQRTDAGDDPSTAAVEASRLRLRPILMTSFAFIFGVLPLVISTGAGAEMRRSLGSAVFSGMLGVTLFGIFLTPVFFRTVQWFGKKPPKPE